MSLGFKIFEFICSAISSMELSDNNTADQIMHCKNDWWSQKNKGLFSTLSMNRNSKNDIILFNSSLQNTSFQSRNACPDIRDRDIKFRSGQKIGGAVTNLTTGHEISTFWGVLLVKTFLSLKFRGNSLFRNTPFYYYSLLISQERKVLILVWKFIISKFF